MDNSELALIVGKMQSDVAAVKEILNRWIETNEKKILSHEELIKKVDAKCKVCPENEPAIMVISQKTYEALNTSYRNRINWIIGIFTFIFITVEFMQNFDKFIKYLL